MLHFPISRVTKHITKLCKKSLFTNDFKCSFDGINDFARICPEFFNIGVNDFSISLIVQRKTTGETEYILYQNDSVTAYWFRFYIGSIMSRFRCEMGGRQFYIQVKGSVLNDLDPHNLVFIVDRSSHLSDRVFLDNVELLSPDITVYPHGAVESVSFDSPLEIAKYSTIEADIYFDELAMFVGKKLSTEEVATLYGNGGYDCGNAEDVDGLTGYIRFEDSENGILLKNTLYELEADEDIVESPVGTPSGDCSVDGTEITFTGAGIVSNSGISFEFGRLYRFTINTSSSDAVGISAYLQRIRINDDLYYDDEGIPIGEEGLHTITAFCNSYSASYFQIQSEELSVTIVMDIVSIELMSQNHGLLKNGAERVAV